VSSIKVFEVVYIAPNVVVKFKPTDKEAVELVNKVLSDKHMPAVETKVKVSVKPISVEGNRVYRAKVVGRSV